MTVGRDGFSKTERAVIAPRERGAPSLYRRRSGIGAFQALVRRRLLVDGDPLFGSRALASLVAPFANGIIKDKAAVSARDFLKLVQWP